MAERPKQNRGEGRLVRPVQTFETYAEAHPEVNLDMGRADGENAEDMIDELNGGG